MKNYCILSGNCNQFTWLTKEKRGEQHTMLKCGQEFKTFYFKAVGKGRGKKIALKKE